MPFSRRALLGAAGALAAPAAPCVPSPASPIGPITVLVPFPPGGATDVQMRGLAEAATRAFGQTVLTENRPGAGSTLGPAAVARAKPDGYLVSQMTLPALRLPFMQRMPYDPRRDFTPILHLTGYTFGVLVRADGRGPTWQELVADARARYGPAPLGQYRRQRHAASRPWWTWPSREKLDVEPSPSVASPKAITALLGGHIEAAGGGHRRCAQLVTDGKLRLS